MAASAGGTARLTRLRDAGEAGGGGGLIEEEQAEDGGADGADAGPDRVGGADGQGLHRPAEQNHAGDQRHAGERGGDRPGEALGVLQADGPADLEQAGHEQDDPGHGRRARLNAQPPVGGMVSR